MTYSLVIEGTNGARKVRGNTVPRRGEWLSLRHDQVWWWLPVLEVAYSLAEGKALDPDEEGCHFVHECARSLVFTSLALAVPAHVRLQEEAVKLVLPPTRWPLGGRVEEETDGGAGDDDLFTPKDRGVLS